jgi:hypothetical protein
MGQSDSDYAPAMDEAEVISTANRIHAKKRWAKATAEQRRAEDGGYLTPKRR